jgi:hypothetical protein
MKIAKLILKGDSQGSKFIDRMVTEIIEDLKKEEYEDEDNDDYDDDDLNDIDLSALGF